MTTSPDTPNQHVDHSVAIGRPANPRLDRVTRLGAAIFDVPMALITVFHEGQASCASRWARGDLLHASSEPTLSSATLDIDQILVVPDLAAAPRARNLEPLRARGIRFYAAYPLRDLTDTIIAAYCLYDTQPRILDEPQAAMLRDIACWAEEELTAVAGLSQAGRVQASMLASQPIDINEWSVDGQCLPALEIGGDFFDYEAEDDVLHLALGDVMGKGTAAALVGAGTRIALRSTLPAALAGVDLGVTMTQVGRGLFADLERVNSFVTLFEAVIDMSDGTLRYVDAGMGLCALQHANGHLEHLRSDDPPFGILADDHWTERHARLEPGSRLLLFSDGLFDFLDHPDNWRPEISALLGAHDSVAELFETMDRMSHRRTQLDDVTIVAVYRGTALTLDRA